MKLLITIVCFLFVTTVIKAQTVDFYGKEVSKDICDQYGMKDDKEANACMDKICDAADIPNNFVLTPCTNIDNCFALNKNGILYIVYDIQFFNKVKTFGFTEKSLPGKSKIDWAALTVLAHELGHHMCQHTTNKLLASRYTPVELELQADEYAGGIMYKLGATLAQAQLAMRGGDVPEVASLTHPGRTARLEAIAKGWNKAHQKYAMKGQAAGPVQVESESKASKGGNASDAGTVSTPPTTPSTPITRPTVALPGMVLVNGGTFSMGSANGGPDEKPVHNVTVSNFYIGINEVTVGEYKAFCAAEGKAMPDAPSWRWNDKDPMENVSYDDATAYCAWLSKVNNTNARLPTEAEWEFAARGGTKSKGYTYSGGGNIEDVGWYGSNAGLQANPVGQKTANELGLFDMSGNVYEWCSDWYGADYYTTSPAQNPKGPDNGTLKVIRGGSWSLEPQFCKPSSRSSNAPNVPYSSIGFRVVVGN